MPTAYDSLLEYAEATPDKTALISEEDGTRSYAELARHSATLAHVLVGDLGLPPVTGSASGCRIDSRRLLHYWRVRAKVLRATLPCTERIPARTLWRCSSALTPWH